MKIEATELLRASLLEGVLIVLAGPAGADAERDRLGAAVQAACVELGAQVAGCRPPLDSEAAIEEQSCEEAVRAALEALGGADVLVVDGAALFAAGQGRGALIGALQASWNVVRALANEAFLPGDRGGRIMLLAPAPDGGDHCEGARAGLENLARTLSIEWARHGVRIVAIAPGCDTDPSEVGAIVAYLASPAGSYFSGCLLDLRGPA